MDRRLSLLFVAVAVLAAAGLTGCTAECEFDTDCGAGSLCGEGTCAALDPAMIGGVEIGACETDLECSKGELCYNRKCTDETLVPNPTTCPAAPLSEELVCSDWDKDECPCYAGVVSFHEKDEGGRLSCAGVVGIFSQFIYIKQSGCHIAALDDQLTGDAVGFGELKLRIAKLPNDTSCSAQPDKWIPDGATDGRPAVRITCSATCKIWMEQFPTPPAERIIPDGQFLMGSSDDLRPIDRPDEGPQHKVDVTCFYMDRFEVSRGQYEQCKAVGTCSAPDYASAGEDELTFFGTSKRSLPMTYVTHAQADAFCKFNEKSLPTEAEWERAARANRWSMANYPWGGSPPFKENGDEDCQMANFAGCAGQMLPVDNGGGDTIRAKGASYFDVVDLGGNVAEWTRDYYKDDTYAIRAASSGPSGAKNPEQLSPGTLGEVRVIRGGSYLDPIDPAATPPQDHLRTHARRPMSQIAAKADLGFRCVRYKPGVAR